MDRIRRFLQEETGMELSEYSAAAAMIVIAILLAITDLTDLITEKINYLVSLMTTK